MTGAYRNASAFYGRIKIDPDYIRSTFQSQEILIPALFDSLRQTSFYTYRPPQWIVDGISTYFMYYVYDEREPDFNVRNATSYAQSSTAAAMFFNWIQITRRIEFVYSLNILI
jgi:hypothetical protein